MLKINNVVKTYISQRDVHVTALKGVTVDLGSKGLVFVLGKSGSGKSTLLNIIGGIDAPTEGEIIINGRSSSTFKESDYDSYRNTYIGFVFQEYNLIGNYSVGANISLALELQGKKADRTEVEKLMNKVGLTDKKGNSLYDRRTDELSGGQKQRVAIARALIKNPEILLCDEPTGALDSRTGKELFELLKTLSKEKLVVVITHDEDHAETYGDRIIELADGEIVSDRKKAEVDRSVNGRCKLLRSKLPAKRILSMGAIGLKVRPFRVAVSILLSVIAFSIFAIALTAGFADELSAQVRTAADSGQKIAFVSLPALSTAGNYYEVDDNENYIYHTNYILLHEHRELITDFNEKYNDGSAIVYTSWYSNRSVSVPRYDSYGHLLQTPLYYDVSLSNALYLNPTTGEHDAGLIRDSRLDQSVPCRLPHDDTEIAITDYVADIILEYGYNVYGQTDDGEGIYDTSVGEKITVTSVDEIIGASLDGRKVTGIYSTAQDKNYYKERLMGFASSEKNEIERELYYDYRNLYAFSVLPYFILNEGSMYNGGNPCDVMLRLSGDVDVDIAFLRSLDDYAKACGSYTQIQLVSDAPVEAAAWLIMYSFIPLIAAAVFLIFAAMFMLYFLLTNIDYRNREYGILRAIGASKRDTMLICLAESFFITCIDFVLSLLLSIIFCIVFNIYFSVALYFVTAPVVALLFVLCFGIGVLSTIMPVRRLASKKPVDIINGRKARR